MYRINILIFIFCAFNVLAQTDIDSLEIYQFSIENGDTFINSTITNVVVYDYENENDKRKYRKTKKRVRKVYPYYLITVEKYKHVNDTLLYFKKKRKKKKYIKHVERDMKSDYMQELKSLKISEGRVLIKLINRDTKQSTYEIIKSLRGNFSAFFWQSLAKIYDNDLKTIYNPELHEEDAMIERALLELKQNNFID